MYDKIENMDNFNLKEYLADNPLLKELAMERAEIYPLIRTFLNNYDSEEGMDREAANLIAMDLVKDFEAFDTVEDKQDMVKIMMNMDDEFVELFSVLSVYFDFGGMTPDEVFTAFINYIRGN